jgi:hypothetical protein
MPLDPDMELVKRAASRAPDAADALRVLVVDGRAPHMAVARVALEGAGHVALAAGFDAAVAAAGAVDVVVLDPGDDERIVPALARALPPEGDLVLFCDRFEWLGRAGRPITLVPGGEVGAVLDVVGAFALRRRTAGGPVGMRAGAHGRVASRA